MKHTGILESIQSVDTLPTLPVIVNQIQKLIASSKSNMSQIAMVIARDQAISARVIRLINSAYFGFSKKIGSIQQAITLLGLTTVKNLVVGVSVIKAFGNSPATSFFDHSKFWLHCFGCGLCARYIAQKLRRPEPEEYFLCGLLHDIGILILDQHAHDAFKDVIQYAQEKSSTYYDAEHAVLDTDHCRVGGYIGLKWKLPATLVACIAGHHRPTVSDPKLGRALDVLPVVHIADISVHNAGLQFGFAQPSMSAPAEALKRAEVRETDLADITGRVKTELNGIMKEWGVC